MLGKGDLFLTAHQTLEEALAQIAERLHGTGRPRVWSIIISAFGDLVPAECDGLPASALQAVLDRLHIGPGAVRTAMSRLAKDGWIERVRNGRNISYCLTEGALPEFELASRKIYGAERPEGHGTPVVLIMPEGRETISHQGLLPLRRGVFLWTGSSDAATRLWPESLQLPLDDTGRLPSWVPGAIAPPGAAMAMTELQASFRPLADTVEKGATMAPLTAAAARTALIHAWRRIALRHPEVPDRLLPDNWPEAETRRFVMTLHAALSPAVELWQTEALPSRKALQTLP